jgi:linoleoyl-CoA desaturase
MNQARITYQNKNCAFTRDLRAAVDSYFKRTGKKKVGGPAMWIEAAIAVSLYLTPLVLLYVGVVSNIWWALGMGIVMGIGFLMVGSDIMHAANHGTFSRSKRINKAFSFSMELLGMSSRNWRVQHNDRHHMHTNVIGEEGDADLTLGEPYLRYSFISGMRGKLIRYQHLYVWVAYAFSFVMWMFHKDFKEQYANWQEHRYRFRKGKELSLFSLYAELVLFKLFYVMIFIAGPILAGAPWYLVLVVWFTSTMFAGAIMMPVFQMAHAVPEVQQFEAGPIETSWMVHQIRTSADIRASNRAMNWLLTHVIGGLNYQKVHHAFRDISHIHYPALSKIVDEHVKKYRIESVTFPSVRSALYAHYRLMRDVGKAPAMG